MSRLQKLQAMLQDDPHDEFLNYALAMEHLSGGQFEEALAVFAQVTARNPQHAAAWFQQAQVHARQGRTVAARAAAEQGVQAARQQGDLHAVQEISGFLAGLT